MAVDKEIKSLYYMEVFAVHYIIKMEEAMKHWNKNKVEENVDCTMPLV